MTNEQYILSYGNPSDGFEYIGTFNTGDEANEYGDEHLQEHDWWVIMLQKPYEEPTDE